MCIRDRTQGKPYDLDVFCQKILEFAIYVKSPQITKFCVEKAIKYAKNLPDQLTTFVLREIFNKNSEKEISQFLNQNGYSEFLRKLQPIIVKAGFDNVEELIYRKLNDLNRLIKFLFIKDRKSEIFQVISEKSQTKAVDDAIVENCELLLSVDQLKLAGLMKNQEISNQIYSKLPGDKKFAFAHSLCETNKKLFASLPLINEDYVNYTKFLIKFHKNETIKFISERFDIMSPSLLVEFERERMFDCAISISVSMNDPLLILQYSQSALRDFLVTMTFCDVNLLNDFQQKSFNVINETKKYFIDSTSVYSILKSFEIPFFCLSNNQTDKYFIERSTAISVVYKSSYKMIPQNFAFPVLNNVIILSYSDSSLSGFRNFIPKYIQKCIESGDINHNDIRESAGDPLLNIFLSMTS